MKRGDAICAEARAGAVPLGPAYQGRKRLRTTVEITSGPILLSKRVKKSFQKSSRIYCRICLLLHILDRIPKLRYLAQETAPTESVPRTDTDELQL